MDKFKQLREKYSTFIYHSFSIEELEDRIHIKYNFEIPGLKTFNPTVDIPNKHISLKNKSKSFIEYLVFHIGMIELISYWKCACPKKVIIKAGYLDKEQIDWFLKLYFYGLGEFFFVNKINTNIMDFMNIIVESTPKEYSINYQGKGMLIPIGGGKDSCVTLELLKEEKNNSCFIINPKPVTLKCAKIAGYKDNDIYCVNRTIHPNLIELNKKGFLNGHTPFSSIVAFLSYLIAYLTDKKYIVLSNEASANESTIKGTKINHQYSKTYEFENDFNVYTKKYFKINIKYFSLLRPLLEYQIGMLFSRYEKYHNIFKSCNIGSKGETWDWCCNCPKCLFVYSILSPFLYKEKLVSIFGEDLFLNKELLNTFIELLGFGKTKPFECIGTCQEVNYAIQKTIKSLKSNNVELPYLLQYYEDHCSCQQSDELEKYYNHLHNLDSYFEKIVKEAIK